MIKLVKVPRTMDRTCPVCGAPRGVECRRGTYSAKKIHYQWVDPEVERAAMPVRRPRRRKCQECGTNYADEPGTVCVGCQAYREHTAC